MFRYVSHLLLVACLVFNRSFNANVCEKLQMLPHEYVNEHSVICTLSAGQQYEEAKGELVHSEDHLIAEPPGDDPSQWM